MTEQPKYVVVDTVQAQRIEVCRLKRENEQLRAQSCRAQSAAIQLQSREQVNSLAAMAAEAETKASEHSAALRALRGEAFGGADVPEWEIREGGAVFSEGRRVIAEDSAAPESPEG